MYASTCSTCHEPDGRGIPGEFPPLLGNERASDAAYVEDTVRNGLSGPIEVMGITYDGSMRAFEDKLSDDEIFAVVAYVGTLAVTDPSAIPETPAVIAEPGSVSEGYDLFIGSTGLTNGGAACAACHTAGRVGNLGGSSLGPDLTNTVEVFGSEDALSGWLGGPASPTMIPIFDERPMTEAEIADLVAYIADAPAQTKPSNDVDLLGVAGLVGFVLLIGGMAVAWRGMRQTYVERLRSKA